MKIVDAKTTEATTSVRSSDALAAQNLVEGARQASADARPAVRKIMSALFRAVRRFVGDGAGRDSANDTKTGSGPGGGVRIWADDVPKDWHDRQYGNGGRSGGVIDWP